MLVRVDGRVVAKRRLEGREFTLDVDLPPREASVRVETVDVRGRRAGSTVRPRARACLARPGPACARRDSTSRCSGSCRQLVARFSGTTGVYVEHLGTGQARGLERPSDVPRRVDAQACDRRHLPRADRWAAARGQQSPTVSCGGC